jgi:hypothetical protein
LVPTLAGAVKTGTNTPTVGKGLGLIGPGGLTSDLIGTDVVGSITGSGGVVGANLAGGNDGLLGSAIGGADSKPLLPQVGKLLSDTKLDQALNSVKALGITGPNGLSNDLLGIDPVGNVVGSNGAIPTALGGGDAGVLGHALPNGNPPLGVVGKTLDGALGVLAGTTPSPLPGLLQGNGLGGGANLPGNLPVLGNVLGTVTNGVKPVVTNVLTTVTGVTGALPIVGPALSGVTGAVSGAANGTGAPAGNILGGVTGGTNSLPVVGSLVSNLTGAGGTGSPVLGNVLNTVSGTVNGLVGGLSGGSNGNPLSGLLGGLKAH